MQGFLSTNLICNSGAWSYNSVSPIIHSPTRGHWFNETPRSSKALKIWTDSSPFILIFFWEIQKCQRRQRALASLGIPRVSWNSSFKNFNTGWNKDADIIPLLMLIGLLLKPVSFRSYLLTHLILQNHLSRDPTLRHLKTSESPFNFPFQQFLKANCPNVILYRNILFLPLLSSTPPFFLISQYLSDKPPNLRNTTLFRKAKHKCFFFFMVVQFRSPGIVDTISLPQDFYKPSRREQ